jgi:hypothetical protein
MLHDKQAMKTMQCKNVLLHMAVEIPIFPWENVILLVTLTSGTFLHLITHLGYQKIILLYAARWRHRDLVAAIFVP